MYIEPNTIIKILANCPLDTTYEHTVYFDNIDNQTEYFSTLVKYVLSHQSYQRVNKGVMRVQIPSENLYDCNYIAFQNTGFGVKWFYAFITGVEYVNNITSEISYEIDVMQTWFFNYQLGECFIEREHASSDEIGGNLVPENLELGAYISDYFDGTGLLGTNAIVVAANFDADYTDIGGAIYGGLYSGVYYHVFTDPIACSEFIMGAAEKSAGIVSVFAMPLSMVTSVGESAKVYNIIKPKYITSVVRSDGMIAKNNKLQTYPYNFLYVSNLQGAHAEYHYEFFNSDSCNFIMGGDMSTDPGVILAPLNYKGIPVNYDEKISLSGFPQLTFNTDSFKEWLGLNKLSLPINALSTAISAGIATGHASVGVGTAIINTLEQSSRYLFAPDQAKGSGGSQTLAALGLLDFAFMNKHITPEFATIIDDYFDMYGYATHEVKIPNRNVRPHWCYTKTKNCVAKGSVPADDMRKICGIYDKGITFWVNGSEIGDYSLNNRVTGVGE